MIQYIKEENTIKVKLLPCPIVFNSEQSDWLEEDTESLAYIKNKPTNVSSFNNDVGYAKTSDLATVATTGDYNDLQNIPTIPVVNDATITLTQGGTVKGSFTLNQSGDATIDLDAGGVSSVDWNDVTNKPSFATVATSGDYNDLDNKPTIPTVDYPVTDVKVNNSSVVNNKVAEITVPTDTGDLTNNAGFITGIDSNDVTTALGYTPGTSNFSGDYTDLTNTPTIPSDTSELTNGAGYITGINSNDVTTALGYIPGTSNFSGSYNDLTDVPTLPNGTYIGTSTNWGQNTGVSYLRTSYFQYNQIPQKKGDLVYSTGTRNLHVCGDVTWDSGQNCFKTTPTFIGNFAAPVNADWNSNSGLSQILNKPTIPANTSDLNNDSGFIDNSVNNLTNYSLTTDIQNNKNLAKGIEYIVGTQTADTNAWLGVSTDTGCSSGNLYVGKVIIYHLPMAGTSSAATLNLTLPDNSTTGAKTIHRQASTTVTTTYVAGCDILMVWDGTYWKVAAYVDTNTNTIGYQLRTNSTVFINKTGYSSNRYTLLFEVEGGLSGACTTIGTGTNKTAVAFKYIPGGRIKYYSTSGAIANDGEFAAGGLWDQYTANLGYTFNTGSTLTAKKPVYMRCTINNDGTLTPYNSGSPSHPIVQDLPTTADGYAYVYLGEAYSTTNIELYITHPIYEFKDGRIRQFQYDPAGSSTDVRINGTSITSSNVADIKTESAYNETTNKIATMSDLPSVPTNISAFNNDSGYLTSESDPVFSASAAAGITSGDITNWNGKTSNIGTITGITMNNTSKGTSGVVDLGTVITSETQLSKGTTTGAGNAVTDINVSNHQITLTKGKTFLESYTETDPVFSASAAAGIQSSDITAWNGKQDPATTLGGYGITDASISSRTVTLGVNSVYVPNILTGSSAPTSGQGNNGDLYLQLI